MSGSNERIYALLVDANPVPNVDKLPPTLAEPPQLYVIDSRSNDMQTQTRPDVTPKTPPRRRAWIPAFAGGLVVVVAVVVGVIVFSGDRSAPPAAQPPAATGTLPDFSSDLSQVGAALTAASDTYDPEVFLSLFAEDAELRFGAQVLTPAEIRSGILLPGPGSHVQYDRGWARTMNQRQVYSGCEVNGDRVLCDMVDTSDHLKPLLPPIPNSAAIQVRDGKIIRFGIAGIRDPSNEILSDFQAWTYENYPEEAALMWEADWEPVEVPTEESALLHLRLGEEYVQLQG